MHVTAIKETNKNPYSVAVIDSVPLNGGRPLAKRESEKKEKRVDVNATRASLRSQMTADTVQ